MKLPSLLEAVLSILVYLPFTEIWFYSWHVLFHKSDWWWSHVHYVHHEWTSPIAITAIYAHWFEFFWINIIMLMLGPFVLGSHVTLWYLYAALGIMSTLQTHSGWHLPWLGAPDAHDYHHSVGIDNYGVLGILDTFHGTNDVFLQSWQSEIDFRYSTQDYPVDKILACNGDGVNNYGKKNSINIENNNNIQMKENIKKLSKVVEEEAEEENDSDFENMDLTN